MSDRGERVLPLWPSPPCRLHTIGYNILTGEYVRGVSDQPMDPVENRSLRRVGVRSESCENRLKERQYGGDNTQEGVRLTRTGHPFAEFHEYARRPSQRQDPSEHHQQTMPLRVKRRKKCYVFIVWRTPAMCR